MIGTFKQASVGAHTHLRFVCVVVGKQNIKLFLAWVDPFKHNIIIAIHGCYYMFCEENSTLGPVGTNNIQICSSVGANMFILQGGRIQLVNKIFMSQDGDGATKVFSTFGLVIGGLGATTIDKFKRLVHLTLFATDQ
ncbi:hypothetical protein ACJX0J_035016 [Zea mays]